MCIRDSTAPEALDNAVEDTPEDQERPPPLAEQRRTAILGVLARAGAARVLDLGCGQGQLVQALLKDARYTEIVGLDVSVRALAVAARRLRLETMGERQASRVRLVQGSLTYTDKRLAGYDAAVLSEVVEHVDPPRLPALAHTVFGSARPATVVVTTPNAEYNVRWESLPAGHVRHSDAPSTPPSARPPGRSSPTPSRRSVPLPGGAWTPATCWSGSANGRRTRRRSPRRTGGTAGRPRAWRVRGSPRSSSSR